MRWTLSKIQTLAHEMMDRSAPGPDIKESRDELRHVVG